MVSGSPGLSQILVGDSEALCLYHCGFLGTLNRYIVLQRRAIIERKWENGGTGGQK